MARRKRGSPEMTTLRFFYNGIKDAQGAPLQKCHYSKGGMTAKWPKDTITIYARDCNRFSAAIREAFTVRNESDGREDYFECDTIYVTPDHPLYAKIHDAYIAQELKWTKNRQKRMETTE